MLEVIKFILKLVVDFVAMLFTIDVGFTSLGMVMCICFIFMPLVLSFIHIIKVISIDEFNNWYDHNRKSHYGVKNKSYERSERE